VSLNIFGIDKQPSFLNIKGFLLFVIFALYKFIFKSEVLTIATLLASPICIALKPTPIF